MLIGTPYPPRVGFSFKINIMNKIEKSIEKINNVNEALEEQVKLFKIAQKAMNDLNKSIEEFKCISND